MINAPLKKIDGSYPLYLPLDDLKQGLTSRQLKVLTLAFSSGYYELPRKIYLENLAKVMSIHRRTFEEHLRKAEKKIMNYLIPSLLL
jgi:predicted DNA binding protein